MLDVSHSFWLVAISLAVALMAGFTGLSLLHGASHLSMNKRKRVVCYAAVTLGGGIWSMHFVAMLGLQLPVLFYYDTLITLLSALIAILVVGVALLLLHFRTRTAVIKTVSGAIIGVGILAMHYMGMSGIQRCLPVYSPSGLVTAIVISIALSICAIWIAYSGRHRRNIVFGTICFGLAVFAVHFIAMANTQFMIIEITEATEQLISNNKLAYIVTFGSFLICSAFLLNTATFVPKRQEGINNHYPLMAEESDNGEGRDNAVYIAETRSMRIPFEKNGKTFFISYNDIAIIRAEGHYTMIYSQDEKLFCPWSLSEAEERLLQTGFVKTHRSYLVNPNHVSGFERTKDNGVCFFDTFESLERAPVSRSRMPAFREALGLN